MKKRSAWPWMGSYVVPKNLRRSGGNAGTWRILFSIPKRLRPDGWPANVELPRDRPYCKGPDDLECIIRIKNDAAALYNAMRAGRNADANVPAVARVGSVPWLIEKWGGRGLLDAVEGKIGTTAAAMNPDPAAREEWLNCEPRTRKLYIRSLRHVLGWSISVRHLPIRDMSTQQPAIFLKRFKPGQRKHIRDALQQLIAIGGDEGVVETNPLTGRPAGIKRQMRKRVKGGRKTKVVLWSPEDVEMYAHTARTVAAWQNARGKRVKTTWPGGAILVRLMYETSADSTDVVTWTKANIVERVGCRGIDYDRGKTGQPGWAPISESLLAEIDSSNSEHLVTDPFGQPYASVTDDSRLDGHRDTLRDQVVGRGGKKLIYDHLRHSAATEAEESGVESDKVRHLTAHKSSAMTREVYVQKSAKISKEIQIKRGLLSNKDETS